MDKIKALGPVEFRFTDPDDVAVYGDRWYRYAEADLIRLRARDLIELETELGMPMVDVMNGMRMRTTLGDLAAAWLGVRAFSPKLAGTFDDFNPLVLSITWRAAQGKAPAGPPVEQDMQPPPVDGSPSTGPSSPETSGTTDTVTLPTSPVAG